MFLKGKKLNIVIMGGGKLGEHVAKVMESRGHKVNVIEKNEEKAKSLSTKISGVVINGDGTDILVLKEAGITKADVFLALSGDDKANLMACEIAKSFNIPKIVAVVNQPGNEELFVKLGIGNIVPVTQQVANAVENIIMSDGSRIIGEIANGAVKIAELVVSENSKYVGKRWSDIKDFFLAGVWRNGTYIFPHNHLKIEAGDVLLVVARTKDMEKIASRLG